MTIASIANSPHVFIAAVGDDRNGASQYNLKRQLEALGLSAWYLGLPLDRRAMETAVCPCLTYFQPSAFVLVLCDQTDDGLVEAARIVEEIKKRSLGLVLVSSGIGCDELPDDLGAHAVVKDGQEICAKIILAHRQHVAA